MKAGLYWVCCVLAGLLLTRGLIDAQTRADHAHMVRTAADQRVAQATATEQALTAARAQIVELQAAVAELAEDAEEASDTVRLRRVLAMCAGVQP